MWLSDAPRAAGKERASDLSKSLLWVPKGSKRAVKPFVGLGTSPLPIDQNVGLLKPIFSRPSTFEVGEGSLAGVEGPAQASLLVVAGSGDTDWSTGCIGEADETSAADCSSGEPPAPSVVPGSLAGSSGEPLQGMGDADCLSGEVAAFLGKAGDSSVARSSAMVSPVSLGRSGDFFSAGPSSGELMEVPGKVDLSF